MRYRCKPDVCVGKNDLTVPRLFGECPAHLSQQEEADFVSLYEDTFFESI